MLLLHHTLYPGNTVHTPANEEVIGVEEVMDKTDEETEEVRKSSGEEESSKLYVLCPRKSGEVMARTLALVNQPISVVYGALHCTFGNLHILGNYTMLCAPPLLVSQLVS